MSLVQVQLMTLVRRSFVLALMLIAFLGSAASAQTEPGFPEPPTIPIPNSSANAQESPESATDGLTIDIGSVTGDEPSQSVLLIVGLSLLSLAPSLVIMLTSFTRIAVVLSLTRNALGLQGVPPNQVIVGLALFLSLFVMGPTLSAINDDALQPYLDGQMEQGEAYEVATGPMKTFMLANTRSAELELMMDATPAGRPDSIDDVGMTTIIPAFILSELKTAFLMGFVIFIPFLIIDLVVASVLMSLGMMMLPPVFVSLPFKLLLFVLVGGWSLIIEALLASYL
ncbi:MAG: flagellar biosynthetic protein FliP [Acidimicrobiales bacterium]|jgi:flagellar biosynthetic protein FliP